LSCLLIIFGEGQQPMLTNIALRQKSWLVTITIFLY
jgi:hypothetical protein